MGVKADLTKGKPGRLQEQWEGLARLHAQTGVRHTVEQRAVSTLIQAPRA